MKLRTWKIKSWDSYDNEYFRIIKCKLLKDAINYCRSLNIRKYSIFDDRGKNVSNDGVSPLNKMMN